jgi:hypothetical protein
MRGCPLTAAGKPIPSRSARTVTAGSVAPVDYRSGRMRPARLRVPKTSSARVVAGLCTATRTCGARVRRVRHRRRALVMMRCCATSTDLTRCDPRTGDIAAATQDRPGQGRRNPGRLPPDHAPAPSPASCGPSATPSSGRRTRGSSTSMSPLGSSGHADPPARAAPARSPARVLVFGQQRVCGHSNERQAKHLLVAAVHRVRGMPAAGGSRQLDLPPARLPVRSSLRSLAARAAAGGTH